MSRGGIEHRATKISLVTGLSTVLTVGFQLTLVPICLKYWGKETYAKCNQSEMEEQQSAYRQA